MRYDKRMETAFAVKTQGFEGPLDMLLSLIEKRKLFINEISLASIAEDYIRHIRAIGDLPVKDASHFILVASTLILIKSRSLLPSLSLTPEEEGNIKDLESRLAYYQHIRYLAGTLRGMWRRHPLFFKEEPRERPVVFYPDSRIVPAVMLASARSVLAELPKFEKETRVPVKTLLSLEDAIAGLEERIRETLSMGFRKFSGMEKGDKVAVVVNFLALLELVRRGVIMAEQTGNFEDIRLESAEVATPRYH